LREKLAVRQRATVRPCWWWSRHPPLPRCWGVPRRRAWEGRRDKVSHCTSPPVDRAGYLLLAKPERVVPRHVPGLPATWCVGAGRRMCCSVLGGCTTAARALAAVTRDSCGGSGGSGRRRRLGLGRRPLLLGHRGCGRRWRRSFARVRRLRRRGLLVPTRPTYLRIQDLLAVFHTLHPPDVAWSADQPHRPSFPSFSANLH
jgi:hypothetical protein